MRLVAAICLSTLLVACGDDGISPQLAEVERAQARWTAQGLVLYTVEARIICFCPPLMNQWHQITVASDSIIAIEPMDAAATDTASAALFSSVDEVFRRIRRWPGELRGNSFEADFDDQTGMPVSVSLATTTDYLDGGARYEFRALKPGLFTRAAHAH